MSDGRLLPVVSTAWRFAGPVFAGTVVLGIAGIFFTPLWILAGILLIFGLYVLFFFRDPERKGPNIPGALLCPADGKVVSIEEMPNEHFPGGRCQRVAIFLSVFDVHVQRAPLSGDVTNVEHKLGKFMNALNEKCSEDNEHTWIWLRHGDDPIGVRQIAGAIARRIVTWSRSGDHVQKGDRIGLICFGSRVEAFLPLRAQVKVKPGMRVRGGESVLAILEDSAHS